MPRYVGVVTLRLKVAIQTSESALPPLRAVSKNGYLKEVVVTPEIDGGTIKLLRFELVYEGNDLTHMCAAFKTEEDGIDVHPNGNLTVIPLAHQAAKLADGLLYNLSGLTLQSYVFTD